jgi:hypothetical protein
MAEGRPRAGEQRGSCVGCRNVLSDVASLLNGIRDGLGESVETLVHAALGRTVRELSVTL